MAEGSTTDAIGAGRPDPLPWPAETPRSGGVVLRAFRDDDVGMLQDLATDPYVPQIGSLPFRADEEEARAYVARQRTRHGDGTGWSFCVADHVTDEALGGAGLWLDHEDPSRTTAGYAVSPRARGRGVAREALRALTGFAWTLPDVQRVELFVEPENVASLRVAEHACYARTGLVRDDVRGRVVDLVRWVAVRPRA